MNNDLQRSLILCDIVYNDPKYKIIKGNEVKYLQFYIQCNKWKSNNSLNKNNLFIKKEPYIAYSKINNILYLSISGTIHNKQFFEYLNGIYDKVYEINEFCEGEYYYHKIFLEYFRRVKNIINNIVSKNLCSKLVISGHSVGGSVAILVALILKLKYPNKKIVFYSFGAPSGCCDKLKLLINNTISKCINFRTKKDFIPKLTPKFLFKSPGKILVIDDCEIDNESKDEDFYYYHKTKNYYYLIDKHFRGK